MPIGAYTQQVLDAAGVTVDFDSSRRTSRASSTQVTGGEADAGIVYATDVIAADDEADGVEIPADVNVIAEYPIAVPATAANADGAAGVRVDSSCVRTARRSSPSTASAAP